MLLSFQSLVHPVLLKQPLLPQRIQLSSFCSSFVFQDVASLLLDPSLPLPQQSHQSSNVLRALHKTVGLPILDD